jgi:hypothetical protein
MANLKVSLVRLCKTKGGWKRYDAAFDANGLVKPNKVIEHGREREYPTGRYYLRYYDGRRTKYENVGMDPAKAGEALQEKSKSLEEEASMKQSASYKYVADFPMHQLAAISQSVRRSQKKIQPEQGNLSLPDSLMKRVAQEAMKNRSTVNEWVCMVIAQRIGAIDAGRI